MIKSVITKEHVDEEEKKYPCLMITRDKHEIVHFSGPKIGQVQWTDKPIHKIGDIYESWDMNSFTPFNGSITLSNEVE